VSLVDIMSTLAELTGQRLGNKEGEDSFSFYKVITGEKKPTRENIIYISSGNKLAIQKDGWKYIDCLGSGGFTDPANVPAVMGGPTGQLYNLVSDPLESKNLFLQESSRSASLTGLLEKLVKQGHSRNQE
jgi:arylsulfatase A